MPETGLRFPPPSAINVTFDAAHTLFSDTPLRLFAPLLGKWFFEDLDRLYHKVGHDSQAVFANILQELNITYQCASQDLAGVPATGPVIVVANHPFGLADGAVTGALLAQVRSDVRFLANSMLARLPQADRHIIAVDNFGGRNAVRANRAPLRQCMQWLDDGGLLMVFPAGEVSSLHPHEFSIRDPAWNANVSRLAERSGAIVVPFFFHGVNSPGFHLAGMVHHQLRTLLLPRELMKKTGTCIRVSIGAKITAQRLSQSAGSRQATDYLRARTHFLRHRPPQSSAKESASVIAHYLKRPAPIAAPVDPSQLQTEIAALPESQTLVHQNEYQVCIASAAQIPATLHELGRLREITFRQASEGTGAARDLDSFDRHYQHLFIWNSGAREIVGAYRLAQTDVIMNRQGVSGLYSGTLFHLHPEFYQAIQPALELGRSFVRPEYQKSYQALLLLWKGLGHYVVQHPQYRIFFGPVSISKAYCESSRALMVSYLKARHSHRELAALVHPKKQFKIRAARECDPRNFSSLIADLNDLSEVISDIEPDRKGLPILLQHYLKLGGQILDFSVDEKFSGVLDGLIFVDLTKTGPRQLERYMGKQAAQDYLLRHAPSVKIA